MKIKEYIIVSDGKYCSSLTEIVNSYINKGWQPLGSPYASFHEIEDEVESYVERTNCQAMVKYEEELSITESKLPINFIDEIVGQCYVPSENYYRITLKSGKEFISKNPVGSSNPIKERKLVDITISYHKDKDNLERVKQSLIDEGWELFKVERVAYPYDTFKMCHMLFMVKYE